MWGLELTLQDLQFEYSNISEVMVIQTSEEWCHSLSGIITPRNLDINDYGKFRINSSRSSFRAQPQAKVQSLIGSGSSMPGQIDCRGKERPHEK